MRPFIHSIDRCACLQFALHRIGCCDEYKLSCIAVPDRPIETGVASRSARRCATSTSLSNGAPELVLDHHSGPLGISPAAMHGMGTKRDSLEPWVRGGTSLLVMALNFFFGENELDLYACCTSSRPCLSLYYLQKSNIASSWNLMAGYVPNSCAVGRITEHLMLKRCFFDVSVAAHKPEQNRSHKPDK